MALTDADVQKQVTMISDIDWAEGKNWMKGKKQWTTVRAADMVVSSQITFLRSP